MRLAILGPVVCVSMSGDEIVPSPHDRALLAALAVDRLRVCAIGELAEAVWGTTLPRSHAKLIRNRVSALRIRLGQGFIERIADGYRLGQRVVLDSDQLFLPDSRTAVLSDDYSTRASWRGEPLVDVCDWPPALPEIARLRLVRSILAESLVERDLINGKAERALLGAQSLVALDAYREKAWVLLVRSLDAAGHQREALNTCQRARNVFAEAGLEIGADLIATERRIVLVEPSPRTTTSHPRSRSLPIGRLIGRDEVLLRLEELLGVHRLVTLVGLGGMGKTRLAEEIVRRIRNRTEGNVSWIVDLATAKTDEDVISVVTRAVGLPLGPTPHNAFQAWAATTAGLLVLDCAEHVRRGTADLVQLALEAGSRVGVLVTSRFALDTHDEVVMTVPPLSLDYAIELFVERSVHRYERSGIELLCSTVGGLPLAVVLAAARAEAVTPKDLANHMSADLAALDESLLDRDRISYIIDGSIASLDEPVRDLLAGLSLFEAPFAIEAIHAVAKSHSSSSSIVSAVVALSRHSLLQVDFGNPTRYRLFELVRNRARALLDDSEFRLGVEQRFIAWAANTVDATRFDTAVELVDEIPNLARAMQMCLAIGDHASGLRLARALMPLSNIGRTEPRDWAAAILAVPGIETDPLFDRVAGDTAFNFAIAGKVDQARAISERVARVAPLTVGDGWARHSLAIIDGDDAQDLKALEIAIAHRDLLLELGVRSTLALRWTVSQPDEAIEHARLSDLRSGESALPWVALVVEFTQGVARIGSDPSGSVYHLRRSLDIADAEGFHMPAAIARVMLLSSTEEAQPRIERDRDALRCVLTAGLDSMAPLVLVQICTDLINDGRIDEAEMIREFLQRNPAPLATTVPGETSSPTGLSASHRKTFSTLRIRSALDVLRLLDEGSVG